MTATWTIPAGNAKVEVAREAFTHAVLGVSIIVLVQPDDIAKIDDEMLRRSAQSVYDEAVAEAATKQ
jgi:hypothetical protein